MNHSPKHILVVDDDERLRQLLQQYLSGEGYIVSAAQDAREAAALLALLLPDLMILDVMMPGQSGLEFAHSLKQAEAPAPPILMLTAKAEGTDRIQGLEAGVEDYLTKPFEPRELLLRMEKILKYTQKTAAPKTLQFGQHCYDTAQKKLSTLTGQAVALTAAEEALLARLAEAETAAVSREELAEVLQSGGDQLRHIDVQIGRLRKKLGADAEAIRTLRGKGYQLIGIGP